MSYDSIDQVVTDFEKTRGPGLFDRLRSAWKTTAVSALALCILGTGGMYMSTRVTDQEVATVAEEMAKPMIDPFWDHSMVEIKNNYLELTVVGDNDFKSEIKTSYPHYAAGLYASPGETVDLNILLNEIEPREYFDSFNYPSFPVGVYVEGCDSEERFIYTVQKNRTYYSEGGDSSKYLSISVDEDTPPGTYPIAIEVYSHTPEEIARALENTYEKELQFRLPEKSIVIARKVIPLVVSDPELAVGISYIKIPYYEDRLDLDFLDPLAQPAKRPGVSYSRKKTEGTENFALVSQLAEKEWSYSWGGLENDDWSWGLHSLPPQKEESQDILVVSLQKQISQNEFEDPVWTTYLPLEAVSLQKRNDKGSLDILVGSFRDKAENEKLPFIDRAVHRIKAEVAERFPSLFQSQLDSMVKLKPAYWSTAIPSREYSEQIVQVRERLFGDSCHFDGNVEFRDFYAGAP